MSNCDDDPVCVVPTGGGKSLIMAAHICDALDGGAKKILLLAHVKELINQNWSALKAWRDDADVGIYSAGLGLRETDRTVTCAGIQSVWKRHDQFGFVDRVVIDEAHLINPLSMGRYRVFLDNLLVINPEMRVAGFTATPYRMGHGYIHEGDRSLFNTIAYEISIAELVRKGFLVKPIPRRGSIVADLSEVKNVGHDYNQGQMAAAFDKEAIVAAAVDDILKVGGDRKSTLIFCANLEHSENVAKELNRRGVRTVATVSGKTPKDERKFLVEAVRAGTITHLINVGVFTTGFDAPNIDCIVLLRATQSPGLYVQMVGRGMRISPGKENLLVLDYGGNVDRHGPLNAITIRPVASSSREEGDGHPLVKECQGCAALIPIGQIVCEFCGHVHPRDSDSRLSAIAGDVPLIETDEPIWRTVKWVRYLRHQKPGSPPCMRVIYGLSDRGPDTFSSSSDDRKTVSEFVFFEHGHRRRREALRWASNRGVTWDMDVDSAINHLWACPIMILVGRNARGYLEVRDYHFTLKEAHEVQL
jgi:DNA repair protein RadD